MGRTACSDPYVCRFHDSKKENSSLKEMDVALVGYKHSGKRKVS